MAKLPLLLISFAIIIGAALGGARLFVNPVPPQVLSFMNNQITLQCEGRVHALTYPTKHEIKDGAIYSSDFINTKSEAHLIVTETERGLEVEDLRCPNSTNQSEQFIAF